jgi:hypothetical protein
MPALMRSACPVAARFRVPFPGSFRELHTTTGGTGMIIFGFVSLIIGIFGKIEFFWSIGVVVLVIGLILALFGATGHEVGGRRHYW